MNVDIHPVRCASSPRWTVYEPRSAEPVAEASTKPRDARLSYASAQHSSGDKVGVVTYRYDAAGTRASKRGRDVDVTYFGLYELERRGMTLYERLSIPTPAGVVAQLERSGADGQTASRLRWLLTDRQGSTETSWVVGEAPEHHRYDAYGGVLSEAGNVTGQRPSETVSHGYTGHEHEDELGLVNMGGRIYSPRLRRFLTADPIVAIPFGQGLNAYSYVMGDPMNLADPTGWQAVPTAGGEEEHAINEDAPDDELPSFGARAVVPAPTGAADAPAAERAGAGAAGQAPAATESVSGPVIIADLSNVADLLDLDLAGYDEGSGRITNFHDAGRSADAMTLLLAERTTVEGRVDVAARRALAAVASLGPGIGEVQDLLLLMDPRALFDDRVMAGVSMLASVVTGGGALNFAAVRAAGGGANLAGPLRYDSGASRCPREGDHGRGRAEHVGDGRAAACWSAELHPDPIGLGQGGCDPDHAAARTCRRCAAA